MKTVAVKALAIIVTISRINDGVTMKAMEKEYTEVFTPYKITEEYVVLESQDGNLFDWIIEENEIWRKDSIAIANMSDNGTDIRTDDMELIEKTAEYEKYILPDFKTEKLLYVMDVRYDTGQFFKKLQVRQQH